MGSAKETRIIEGDTVLGDSLSWMPQGIEFAEPTFEQVWSAQREM